MIASDTVTAMTPVVAALERLGVRYYVGGSAASSTYGLPRSTMDVDLVAQLTPQHVARFVEALKSEYYIDANMILDAIARQSCFNLIHLPTSFKVDVFLVKNRPYDRVVLERIQKEPLEAEQQTGQFFVASPEDVVLAKLEWYRLGDEISERQWGDVLGVLKVQAGGLDRAYMQRWAAELGVADLLEKAWNEAGI